MVNFHIDDCFLENLSNLHIYDNKINSTTLDSSLHDDNNMSLESLLCSDTDEPYMHKFFHNKNNCFVEDFSNLHIYDKGKNSTSLDSGLHNDNMSLESLLCDDTDEPYMHKFFHNKNDSFLKNFKNIQIFPSLTCILSDENEFPIKLSNHTKPHNHDSKKQEKYNKKKSSLFYKALTAKIKLEKHKELKLQQIKTSLNLHEPNSWYSVYLLVSLANSKSFNMIKK